MDFASPNTCQVRDVCVKSLVRIDPGENLDRAIQTMLDHNVGSLIVSRDGRDAILPFYASVRAHRNGMAAAAVASLNFLDGATIAAHETLATAMTQMSQTKSWRLVVLDETGATLGILSASDLFSWFGRATLATKWSDQMFTLASVTAVLNDFGCTMYRAHQVAVSIEGATDWRLETGSIGGAQRMALLRVFTGDEVRGAFFVDAEDNQANVRAVDPSLETLAATIEWLLPSDLHARQGDLGVQIADAIPSEARDVTDDFDVEFDLPLHGRHRFTKNDVRYFRRNDRYFVELPTGASLVHPEHEATILSEGRYELIPARGTPMPKQAISF